MPINKVVDCFTFFNEFDILEIRLRELYDHVDRFVICEATQTFQGAPKPLYFAENRDRFTPFLDKITHLAVDDMPATSDPWQREHHQRTALRRALNDCSDDDFIIISDADEILRGDIIQKIRDENPVYAMFDMPMYQYYMNLLSDPCGWRKPFGFKRSYLDALNDFNIIRTGTDAEFCRHGSNAVLFHASGWHFTYLGGAAKILEKLKAYSHTEAWATSLTNNEGNLRRQINVGFIVGSFWHLARFVPIDETYPRAVRENQAGYYSNGFIRDIYEAIATMQNMYREIESIVIKLQGQ